MVLWAGWGFRGISRSRAKKAGVPLMLIGVKRVFSWVQSNGFFSTNAGFGELLLLLPQNLMTMKNRKSFIVWLLALFLLLSSCASQRSSRAMRKAERQMERAEKRSEKELKQAKSAHYKHQAKKTKKMIKQDKRRAERMRRHQRTNPYY